VRIAIPSIGIDAVIEEIEIDKGIMGVPEDAWNVGWYGDLPRPGERTNVVMAAHRDWWGIGPVVFYRLEEVRPGDRVYVTSAKGTGATYEVVEIFQVDAGIDATPLIDDQGGETLTLITCGGAFNGVEYLNRWIVRAKRI
jgi:LPXTG-site transpeptidase (sortase) family protein